MGDGGMGHLRMTNSEATYSHSKGQIHKRPRRQKQARSPSHHSVSSPRCGFLCLHKELDERLAAWSLEEGENLDDIGYQYRYMSVSSLSLKHAIGQGGSTLHKLESFVDLSASVVDINAAPKICVVGCPRACFPSSLLR